MQRQSLYQLLKYHFEKNERLFLKTSRQIAWDLELSGDKKLALEMNKLIRANSKVVTSNFINQPKMILNQEQNKWIDIVSNGIKERLVNKIIIYGSPGTGKTLFVKTKSVKLGKELKIVELSEIIDAKLGQSMKQLDIIFKQNQGKIIFIDEIDSIATIRGATNDLVEINRILNHLLQLMDNMSKDTILIVATNRIDKIDEAFIRRFDISFSFNHYSLEDKLKILNLNKEQNIIDWTNEYTTNFKKMLIKTHQFWTPGYIAKASMVSSLWQAKGEIPSQQLLDILKFLNLGRNKDSIIAKLKELKVPLRTIDYFF